MVQDYGHQVTIVSLFESPSDPFYPFDGAVDFRFLGLLHSKELFSRSFKVRIKSILDELDPDVVTVCDDGYKGLLMPNLLPKTVKLVYERHAPKSFSFHKRPKYLRWLSGIQLGRMDKLAKRYDRVVLLTEGNRNEWNIDNCLVIPNPLSWEDTETSALDRKVVLAVGKQGRVKSYDRLLKIWKRVIEERQGWELKIVGKFNPALELEQLRSDLGLDQSVAFIPPTTAIEKFYEEASIYVMSSVLEGFGMVLIEAMQHGVPCIAYDCPYGPADIIDDGQNGYLIENGDQDSYAFYLSKLMDDPKLRKELGRGAVKKSRQYRLRAIMPKWDALYRDLVNE